MIVSQRTDVGRKRSHNEDSMGVTSFSIRQAGRGVSLSVAMVCDGMGGAAAGEIASGMAVAGLSQGLYAAMLEMVLDSAVAFVGMRKALREVVQATNRAVHDAARDRPGHSGMGCTATVAVVGFSRVWFAQVGDSRGYLYRDGALTQITRDHSFVSELLLEGRLTAEEAEAHPRKSVITRAIGSRPEVEPDVFEVPLKVGDMLFVCSDGLTGMVGDPELAAILAEVPPSREAASLDRAAAAMIARANENGGTDNISVVLGAVETGDVAGPLEDPPVLVPGKVLSWQEAIDGGFPDHGFEEVRGRRRRP